MGFGINKLTAVGQEVVEELLTRKTAKNPTNDIRALISGSSNLSKQSQTHLARILDRWDSLSKQSKSLISILSQSKCSPGEVQQLKTSSLNFVREVVRIRGSDRPLVAVEPFHSHLKQVAGGEPLVKFMCKNFHRVGENMAHKFLLYAGFDVNRLTRTLSNEDFVTFVGALHRFSDFLTPDASCLSPLGEELMRRGIQKELQPEFSAVAVRNPSAYSGYPFIVEASLAYGGKQIQPGLKLFRFANRIPLLYDEANDVSWQILEEVDWRRYRVPEGAPLAIATHVCSTRIPYKTVGKEYLADRPELERELRNAIRDVLRNLSGYLSRKGSIEQVKRKMNILGKYLPLIATFSTDLSAAKRPPRYRRLLGQQEEAPEQLEVKQKQLDQQTPIIKKVAEEMQTKLEQFND
jgi:DNA topoisomerase-6 subunit B